MSAMAKFLIVDDSRAIQSIIKRVIESCDYPSLDIQTVSNAEAAIDLLESYQPNLIITDWHMHKISGLEFCQHVCQSYGTEIPIGFVTTESASDKIEQAYQSGASFVMNKPFQDVDLRNQILTLVPAINPIAMQETALDNNLAGSQALLSRMLKGKAYSLEPCPPLVLSDFSENNLIGLFGEEGKTPPVNALAIMEMHAVAMLWAVNNNQISMLPALIKSGNASNDQLNEARDFLGEFGAGLSLSYKHGPLKLARASIVSRTFPRLEMSLKTNQGRADYKLNIPGVGTGFVTYIRLI